MNAEILAVGTELLLGNITNTDAQDISVALSELGINVFWHTVVGDNPERLTEAVNIAKGRADLIITTGGLGPTCDDLTKQVLAAAFGLDMYFDEAQAENIKSWFASRHGMAMTQNNLQQAMLPAGCTVFTNEWGTAPGCAFARDGVHVVMLPGPPRECNAMLRNRVVPYLRSLSGDVIISHNLHVFGMGESSVESMLREMMNELSNPTLAPYAKEGEVRLRVTAKAASQEDAESMMRPVIEQVTGVLGDMIYGVDAGSLEERVFELLKERGMTMAAAESCTGGLLAKRITDLPGASAVFRGGVTVYCNESKTALLGVEPDVIAEHGAVSEPVARLMARRVREKLGADLGVGITGLAGPDGDGVHAVGTVFVALASADGTWARGAEFGTIRSRVRTMAVNTALDMARRLLTGLPVE